MIAPGRVGMIRMFWGKHPEAGLRGNIRLIRRDRARICLTFLRPAVVACLPTIVGAESQRAGRPDLHRATRLAVVSGA